ncbi:MAG TPA: sigma-70 family RNA polymerase sigma factor [Bryobacteraceae bacterium]|nr:sigma-70 family RNA polymerase sigma factor [Bryobacteraceae bacterium]
MPEGRETSDVTGLLDRWRLGDPAAANELAALVYGDLHRIAAREMRRERGDHTLQTTAILHEAYLRIFHSEPVAFNDRAHFFAVATQQLRRVLLDHARKANSLKRGGGAVELSLLQHDGATIGLDERLLMVNDALTRLEHLDPRAAKVVELRYFGGLTEADAAEVLGVSVATLKRDWDFAKTWLADQLGRNSP